MRKTNRAEYWVVYQRTWTIQRKQVVSNSVCEQAEWDALDSAEPGVHTLVRERIASEEAAERLARGTSGDGYRNSCHNYSTKTVRP
jgi:hypothetical protein